MPTIQVQCVEHDLMIVNTPLLASGSVGVDFIHFSFCPLWEGTAKCVLFFSDDMPGIPPVLLDDSGICAIPPEAIYSEGKLKFGVVGIRGDETISTEVLEYRINKGVYTPGSIPEPSGDIYDQITGILAEIEVDISDIKTATANLESYLSTV